MNTRNSLSDETKLEFACMITLYHIIVLEEKIHLSLLENDDKHLEPFLAQMEKESLIEEGEENVYRATAKGENTLQKLYDRQFSYQTHFEVYAYVDLAEGVFGDPETDLLEDERWEDLRVCVAEYKGIDPYQVVFLAMLSDETFFENPDWKFDLAMESLFTEMENIVHSQISADELSYETEEGFVSGEEVLEDVIAQGSVISQTRFKERQAQEEASAQQQTMPAEEIITTTTTYYH